MATLSSVETFAIERESLSLKLDFSSGNVAGAFFFKYTFQVLMPQCQIDDIAQFGDICKEMESLSFKLDFSSEHVAVEISKYIFPVLRPQRQIADITQSADNCKRKGSSEYQV